MTTAQDDGEADLARWLEEVGRRKFSPTSLEEDPLPTPQPARPRIPRPALSFLLVVAALTYLFYYFTDVQLHIILLPALVVFVAG